LGKAKDLASAVPWSYAEDGALTYNREAALRARERGRAALGVAAEQQAGSTHWMRLPVTRSEGRSSSLLSE